MGSQSSRIAAYQMGFDYYGWEIDKEYFEAGNKRFIEQTAQLKLL
jgi:site-specific DNA-methyltransferase (adenine-specific)